MKITIRIKAIGALLSLLLLVIIVATIYLIQNKKKDSEVVNIAGRERMLTQHISKNVFYAMVVRKLDEQSLQKAKNELRANFNDLYHGNTERDIYAPQTSEIKNQLAKIDTLLERFENAIDTFGESFRASVELFKKAGTMNSSLLEISEQVTKRGVEIGAGEGVIDRAGRQRMLTQKIAYALSEFFSLRTLESYKLVADLLREYEATLTAFEQNKKYMQDSEAKRLLKENRAAFDRYDAAIEVLMNQHMILNKQLEFIYEFNTVLLEALDAVVQSYADYTEAKRQFIERIQLGAGGVALFFVFFAFFGIRDIAREFEGFSKTTQMLQEEGSSATRYAGSELTDASMKIEEFVKNIDKAILHAKAAVAESERAAREIGELSEQMESTIRSCDADGEVKANIGRYLDRSEDIAIQSVEELHSTSVMLDKLHENLHMILNKTKENPSHKA